jgi:hypothetical protein
MTTTGKQQNKAPARAGALFLNICEISVKKRLFFL